MDSDTWCSPRKVTIPLAQFHRGPVDFDPCSNPRSLVKARKSLHAGGLHLPWRLSRPVNAAVYENPPYSKNDLWTQKAMNEIIVGNVEDLVRLVMVSTSTKWWRQQCGVIPTTVDVNGQRRARVPRNPRLCFTKRLKFIGDKDCGARFDTVLVYYGDRARAFEKEFSHIIQWSTWGR